MLQARFIADLEKYNEWMNEEDYIIAEDDDDDDDEAERGDADDTAEVSPSYFLRSLLRQPPLPHPLSLLSLACRGPQCEPAASAALQRRRCPGQHGRPRPALHSLSACAQNAQARTLLALSYRCSAQRSKRRPCPWVFPLV
jgi:hypothetical protein